MQDVLLFAIGMAVGSVLTIGIAIAILLAEVADHPDYWSEK